MHTWYFCQISMCVALNHIKVNESTWKVGRVCMCSLGGPCEYCSWAKWMSQPERTCTSSKPHDTLKLNALHCTSYMWIELFEVVIVRVYIKSNLASAIVASVYISDGAFGIYLICISSVLFDVLVCLCVHWDTVLCCVLSYYMHILSISSPLPHTPQPSVIWY